MVRRLRAFGAFCYDFVVGDDWRVAVAVVLGLVFTWLLARVGVPSWWLLPVVVLVVLPWSLWRATRPTGRG
ncbi:MAG TPA: hypothetical protein VGG05_01110 [Pseudonocardiaceae bacterium]|jgi:hypothetical protein